MPRLVRKLNPGDRIQVGEATVENGSKHPVKLIFRAPLEVPIYPVHSPNRLDREDGGGIESSETAE